MPRGPVLLALALFAPTALAADPIALEGEWLTRYLVWDGIRDVAIAGPERSESATLVLRALADWDVVVGASRLTCQDGDAFLGPAGLDGFVRVTDGAACALDAQPDGTYTVTWDKQLVSAGAGNLREAVYLSQSRGVFAAASG